MDRVKALELCEEYLHQIWYIESMKDDGFFVLYGLEQHRIVIHNSLCALLGIDNAKSKSILSYLDEKIGFDFSKIPGKSDLKYYSEKLLNLPLEEKEKGNI